MNNRKKNSEERSNKNFPKPSFFREFLSEEGPGKLKSLFFFTVFFIIINMFSALSISANFRPNTPFNFIDHFHMTSLRPCLCTKNNPVGIDLFSHVKTFFYSKQFAKLLTT